MKRHPLSMRGYSTEQNKNLKSRQTIRQSVLKLLHSEILLTIPVSTRQGSGAARTHRMTKTVRFVQSCVDWQDKEERKIFRRRTREHRQA